MSMFALGILTAFLPSVLAVAWLVWRIDTEGAPQVRNSRYAGPEELRQVPLGLDQKR